MGGQNRARLPPRGAPCQRRPNCAWGWCRAIVPPCPAVEASWRRLPDLPVPCSPDCLRGPTLRAMPSWLPLLLGYLTALGPLATDMYLPAFPAIEASLAAGAGSAQATLAAWFAGLAVGQMVQGTLSDRFGR